MAHFQRALDDCLQGDLGFDGPVMTWNNGHSDRSNVQERLARAGSDHKVVCIDLEGNNRQSRGHYEGLDFRGGCWIRNSQMFVSTDGPFLHSTVLHDRSWQTWRHD
ncbi:hypothetical protein PanWU01x14_280500 [Parasponia andersonii]|uniref:Endonuclease/exonuclease/phosphatase n=1 Tax=Parasponia andersonii TaxID=3476 RepID=A0A2P5B1L8_PARAD|nr:hypothetical protein PanWU01x14_280500 [Parasponia andersonii]